MFNWLVQSKYRATVRQSSIPDFLSHPNHQLNAQIGDYRAAIAPRTVLSDFNPNSVEIGAIRGQNQTPLRSLLLDNLLQTVAVVTSPLSD
jgi:hypothetical protein